jgi:hypothetical protein
MDHDNGGPFGKEKPAHQGPFTYDYDMGDYEIAPWEYEPVMGENSSHFKGSALPVDNLTYTEAAAFSFFKVIETGMEIFSGWTQELSRR